MNPTHRRTHIHINAFNKFNKGTNDNSNYCVFKVFSIKLPVFTFVTNIIAINFSLRYENY